MPKSSAPSVPVTYMRGGTSKALFLHARDVPSPGPERDRFLIRMMGSPDPMQIDGMGGTHIVTSKIAIISPSERKGVDVDYTFVQVGINEADIDYSANCGNISAGVGPFAIQEGLTKDFRKGISLEDGKIQTQEVRIFNTGTKKVLVSHVAIDDEGLPLEDQGHFEIAGCPGSAAPILMDYRNVIGAALGKGPIPTDEVVKVASVAGRDVEYTVCDVANIIVFASAESLGISGAESPSSLNDNKELIARVKELRGKVAQDIGLCQNWERVDEEAGMLPMVALVSPPTNPEASIRSRIFLDNHCHSSMAGTGAICTTACSRITGSVVNKLVAPSRLKEQTFQIQHPLGLMPVIVESELDLSSSAIPKFNALSFVRTARRIWDGKIYIPISVRDTLNKIPKAQLASKAPKSTPMNQTENYAQFVHDLSFADLNGDIITKLKSLVLDHIGVAAAATQQAESTSSFIAAVKALSGTSGGTSTVIANGSGFAPPYAALLNAAFSHSLDFDDTHADGFLHPGTTVIATALVEAEANPQIATEDFITALAAGYEIECRLGMALGSGGPAKGFHNTAIAGIFGAVATLAKLRKGSLPMINNAFGLALSRAAGSMQYLSNGAWIKRLHPGFAAHDAFLVLAFAQAGVTGAAKAFEGQFGLLNLYSNAPHPEVLDAPFEAAKLSFMDTSIKPYPACRLTHPQIEAAGKIRDKLGLQLYPSLVSDIQHISVKMSPEAFGIVGAPNRNKTHPQNVVNAQFSSYYQTVITLIHGSSLVWHIYDHLNDSAVKTLLDKITITPVSSFGRIETILEITWKDGRTTTEHATSLRGEPGTPFSWDDIVAKFVTVATPVFGAAKRDIIIELVHNLEKSSVVEMMKLVA